MALAPEFIEVDLQAIIDEMVQDYEDRTGKTLQPASVERLLIESYAYRELLVRSAIQEASEQNLVAFSSAPVLDYLGEIVGVVRLAETSATAYVRFTLTPDHGDVIIPQGTRLATVDNLGVFATQSAAAIPEGEDTVDILVQSVTPGTDGNGYQAGTITEILDPQAFISSASNTTPSGGGSAQETDDALRERIRLAPGAFSNAGSRGAYEFFATSANPLIIDVAVLGPESDPSTPPGEVHIYPLMADGSETPSTVIDQVYASVNNEKVRPLTDLVRVFSPNRIDYELNIGLTLYSSADPVSVQSQVTAAVNAYVLEKRNSLGQDIKLSQIIQTALIPGQVYDVDVYSPGNIPVDSTSFAFAVSIMISVIGTTNG